MNALLTMVAAMLVLGQSWLLSHTNSAMLAQIDNALALRRQLQGVAPASAARRFCSSSVVDSKRPCQLTLQTRHEGEWENTCDQALRGQASRYWRVQLICTTPSWLGTLRLRHERFIELLD